MQKYVNLRFSCPRCCSDHWGGTVDIATCNSCGFSWRREDDWLFFVLVEMSKPETPEEFVAFHEQHHQLGIPCKQRYPCGSSRR